MVYIIELYQITGKIPPQYSLKPFLILPQRLHSYHVTSMPISQNNLTSTKYENWLTFQA